MTDTSANPDGPISHFFVVRKEAGWILAPVPSRPPESITTARLLERIRSGVGSLPDGRHELTTLEGVIAPPLLPTDRIAPVWAATGLVADGLLVVGAPGGDRVALAESDVIVLDALTADRRIDEIDDEAAGLDLAERCAAYGRLAAVGLVRVLERAGDETEENSDLGGAAEAVAVELRPNTGRTLAGSPADSRNEPVVENNDAGTPVAGTVVSRVRGSLGRRLGRRGSENS